MTPINLATNTAGAPITGGGVERPIRGIAVTPDGRIAYVTNGESGANSVTPINLATDTAGAPIAEGNHPVDVAITPDQAPTAAFSATAGTPGNPTTFNASASSSPVGLDRFLRLELR